mgnify:CR=1 FL=1
MRSKSTLLLIAAGCLGWYVANREAIAAQSAGEAGTYDLWWPFIIWFGVAALIRAIYRKVSRKPSATTTESRSKSAAEPKPTRSSTPTSEGSNARQVLECGDCGAEVAVGANFCPSCGTNFDKETFECAYCDAEVPTDANFCPSCGAEFEG